MLCCNRTWLYQRTLFPADPPTYKNPVNALFHNDGNGGRQRRQFNGWTPTFDLSFHASYGYRGRLRCNDVSVYQGKYALPTNFDLEEPQQSTGLRVDWTARGGR